MKKFLLSVLLVLGLYSAPVNAQQAGSSLIVSTCGTLPTGVVYAAGKYGIRTMDTTGKDCSGATFTGSVSATTAATSQSTLPTLSPSASSPIYESLGAGLYTQPVFGSATGGGTQVDATHGLPVNVIAGGAGGGAVFGPTAVGSAAANPPVLMGGTANGTATGNVSVWEVISGIGYANLAQVGGSSFVLGQQLAAASLPVVLTAAQITALTPPSNTGYSTAALQTTGNTSLATIATNTGAAIPAQSTHTVNIGAVDSISPYPATAVPITASATGTTTATTATLTNVTSHTTYICGFSIRANATAAATNNATVTGTITGTLNFTQWTAPLASGLGVTEEVFSPCVPASGVSTSIAVVSGAPGSGGVVSVSAWGYSL